jgi:hypothetical protein
LIHPFLRGPTHTNPLALPYVEYQDLKREKLDATLRKNMKVMPEYLKHVIVDLQVPDIFVDGGTIGFERFP